MTTSRHTKDDIFDVVEERVVKQIALSQLVDAQVQLKVKDIFVTPAVIIGGWTFASSASSGVVLAIKKILKIPFPSQFFVPVKNGKGDLEIRYDVAGRAGESITRIEGLEYIPKLPTYLILDLVSGLCNLLAYDVAGSRVGVPALPNTHFSNGQLCPGTQVASSMGAMVANICSKGLVDVAELEKVFVNWSNSEFNTDLLSEWRPTSSGGGPETDTFKMVWDSLVWDAEGKYIGSAGVSWKTVEPMKPTDKAMWRAIAVRKGA